MSKVRSLLIIACVLFVHQACKADWSVTCGEFHNHCHKWYNPAILQNVGEHISEADYKNECDRFPEKHENCHWWCSDGLHSQCETNWHQEWCKFKNDYIFCRNLCTLMSASGNGECGKYWDPT
jgi:hypothetical protein